MTAPETIYAWDYDVPDDGIFGATIWGQNDPAPITATKYTRADLADANVAAALLAAAGECYDREDARAIARLATQPQTDALQAMIDAAVKDSVAIITAEIRSCWVHNETTHIHILTDIRSKIASLSVAQIVVSDETDTLAKIGGAS